MDREESKILGIAVEKMELGKEKRKMVAGGELESPTSGL
jgi:hypothetical protein